MGQRFARDRDEQFFERVLAVLARKTLGIAFQQDPAMRQEQDAVADLRDFIHVVRRPEHTASAPGREVADVCANLLSGSGIERGGGFVEQQKLRAVEHRFGEADPGLFAGGEDAAVGVAETVQIELVEQLFDAAEIFLTL